MNVDFKTKKNNIDKKIGKFLRKIREKKGLTQKQMGKIIKKTSFSYLRYENGINPIQTSDLIIILNFYGLSIKDLKI